MVAERHRAALDAAAQASAAGRAGRAADLEDVREIRVEVERQGRRDRLRLIIADVQVLVTDPAPEELGAGDVQRAARDRHAAVGRHVRIGQVDGEDGVVLADGRAEEHRPLAAEAEHQAREVAGAVVEQPLLAQPGGADVAEMVEDDERVALFEHPPLFVGDG